jgi:hypothetical protein
MVTVGRYRFGYEAHLACAKLRDEGIEAFVADEQIALPLHSPAIGWVRVEVWEGDSDAALRVLARDESAMVDALTAEELDARAIPSAPPIHPRGPRRRREVPAWLVLVALGAVAALVFRGHRAWW